jgi:4-hydroxybenzoate polyprenyltransferase
MQTTARPGGPEAPDQTVPDEDNTPQPAKTSSVLVLLLRAMRPKQWSKNILLFAGLLFSLRFTDPVAITRAFLGFALFCIFSSCVYLMNDVRDREKDRLNPRTARRPIASGALKPSIAIAAFAILLPVAFILSWLLDPWFALIAAIYMAKDIAYSYGLKHVVILDVFLIAAGFTLRAVAGVVAIGAPISSWLYVVTSLGALFLALNKRKHEVLLLGENASSHRRVLGEYSPALIEEMLAVVTASTVMSYSLYTITADNLPKPLQENHLMMITIPFVLYGIFRYLYLVYQKNEGSSPEEVIFRDRPLLICGILWAFTAGTLLYIFSPISGLFPQ